MSPANRPGGRSQRTVSGGGNVFRRGSGLGSGSVGNGPRGSSGGSFGGGGDRGVGGGGLLAVLLALLIGGASNNNGNGNSKRGCLGRHSRARADHCRRGAAIQYVLRQHERRCFSSGLLGDYTTHDNGPRLKQRGYARI